MGPDLEARIEEDFATHTADDTGIMKMKYMRETMKKLAIDIADTVPAGREQALALTKLEECMFWSNAGISRKYPINA